MKSAPKSQNIRVAILETQLSALESRISSSNAGVESQLKHISSGIKELHDKIDLHILKQTEEITRLKVKQDGYDTALDKTDKEIKRVESKIWKIGSIVGTIVAAIITGGVELFRK